MKHIKTVLLQEIKKKTRICSGQIQPGGRFRLDREPSIPNSNSDISRVADQNKFAVPKNENPSDIEHRVNQIQMMRPRIGSSRNSVHSKHPILSTDRFEETTDNQYQITGGFAGEKENEKPSSVRSAAQNSAKTRAKPTEPHLIETVHITYYNNPSIDLHRIESHHVSSRTDFQVYYQYVKPTEPMISYKRTEVFHLLIRYLSKPDSSSGNLGVVQVRQESEESPIKEVDQGYNRQEQQIARQELNISNNMISVNVAPVYNRRSIEPAFVYSDYDSTFVKSKLETEDSHSLPPQPASQAISIKKSQSRLSMPKNENEDQKKPRSIISKPKIPSQYGNGKIREAGSLSRDSNKRDNGHETQMGIIGIGDDISMDTHKDFRKNSGSPMITGGRKAQSDIEIKEGNKREEDLFKSAFKDEEDSKDGAASQKIQGSETNSNKVKSIKIHSELSDKNSVSRISRHSGLLNYETKEDLNPGKNNTEIISIDPDNIGLVSEVNNPQPESTPISKELLPIIKKPSNHSDLLKRMYSQTDLKKAMNVRFADLKLTQPLPPCSKLQHPSIPTFSVSLKPQFRSVSRIESLLLESPTPITNAVPHSTNITSTPKDNSMISHSKASENMLQDTKGEK